MKRTPISAADDGPLKLLAKGARIDVLANDTFGSTVPAPAQVRVRIIDDPADSGAFFDDAGMLVVPASERHDVRAVRYEICDAASTTNCAEATAKFSMFTVFDSTLYSGKPAEGLPGVTPLAMLYSVAPGPGQPGDALFNAKLQEALSMKTGRIVLDAEAWPLMVSDITVAQQSASNYLTLLQRFRAAAPQISWSYYSIAPAGDYYNATGLTGPSGVDLYHRINDLVQPIADLVPALFPTLYTLYDDRAMNDKYLIANIQEARRLAKGKPVYAVIWPQYFEAGTYKDHRFLPPDYWRRILETCKEWADGVVIWGGWNFATNAGAMRWDGSAPWWQQTTSFMSTLGQPAP